MGTERPVVDAGSGIVVHGKWCTLEAVLQALDNVIHSETLIRNDPHGQRLHFAHRPFSLDIGQIAVHARREMTVDGPHTRVPHASSAERGRIEGVAETELTITALEVTALASKVDAIGRNHHIGRVSQVHTTDTALVGMRHHRIIRNTHSNPHDMLTAWPAARHLEQPSLVRVTHRERLARTAKSVFVGQTGHYLDRLTSRAGTLQSQIHQRPIVDNPFTINQFFSTFKGRFADCHLPLIDVARHQIGHWSLGNLSVIDARVTVINLAHSSGLMLARLIPIHLVTCSPRVNVVSAHD